MIASDYFSRNPTSFKRIEGHTLIIQATQHYRSKHDTHVHYFKHIQKKVSPSFELDKATVSFYKTLNI